MELIILLITIVMVIIAALSSLVNGSEHPFPFRKKDRLFSHAERAFLDLVERAVGAEYKIINRVRLSDVLTLHENLSKRSRQNVLSKANNRYLDFVLCDKETFEVIAAIDLVNISNQNGHKQKQDWFLHGALDASRVPYIRIQIRNGYKPNEIRDCIMAKLNKQIIRKKPIMKGKEIPASMIRPRLPQQKPTVSTGLIQA